MRLKKILSKDAFWTINKSIAKEIGLNATLLLQHLIDFTEYHKKEWIFQTYQQMIEELGISEHSIKNKCIPKLKELGFISVKRGGIGNKNYYKINEEKIMEFLTHPTSEVKTTPPSEVSIDSPMSEVKTPPLVSTNSPHLQGENTTTIKKNIIKRNNKKETINNGITPEFIDNKILDILIDRNIDTDNKKFITALEYYNEIGGLNNIAKIMNWDDSQKNNWSRALNTIIN